MSALSMRKRRARENSILRRFMLFPQRVIAPHYEDVTPMQALIGGTWALEEPEAGWGNIDLARTHHERGHHA